MSPGSTSVSRRYTYNYKEHTQSSMHLVSTCNNFTPENLYSSSIIIKLLSRSKLIFTDLAVGLDVLDEGHEIDP